MAIRKEDEYQSLKFYKQNTKAKTAGFSKFDAGGEYYFCRFVDGEIALISQGYVSAAGRDNGIASVKKNEKIKGRYTFESRDAKKFGFSLKAGNSQEIAISPDFSTAGRAGHIAGRLNGSVKGKAAVKPKPKPEAKNPEAKKITPKATPKKKTANVEQNYKPLAFYERQTKGRKKGIETFKGDDGEYYFVYFENNEIVLISEGYPTQSAQQTGVNSVETNLPLEARYKYRGRLKKSGKYDFSLKAGNHKEIARSRWYDSAAAAATGAAYLMGKRKRVVKAAPIAAAGAAAAGMVAAATVAAAPKPAPIVAPQPTPKPALKPIAAAPVAAAAAIPSGGGIWGWLKWLLLALFALLALLFLFKACSGKTAAVKTTPVAAVPVVAPTPKPIPEPVPQPVPEPVPEPIPEPVIEPVPAPPPPAPVVATGLSCACGTSSSLLFNIPNQTPKNVSYLGSNPQFGDSHALSPADFHQKLTTRYNNSNYDASYLDYLFKALGYDGGFSDVDASAFSNDTLPKGAEGILGYGQRHVLQHSKLNVPARDLEAFRVTSANGCDVHFMKTCGNYMYACNP